MTDKKFEELLKEAVEQCAEKEWEEISQKSKKIRYKPSKEFEEKMENLYQKESCQNNFIGDEQIKSERKHFHMGNYFSCGFSGGFTLWQCICQGNNPGVEK